MIEIMNLKKDKPKYDYDIVIDRSSEYGNPFIMKNKSYTERKRVCSLFEEYIETDTWKTKLNKLLKIYKKYGKLRLFCWCYPKKCHGNTIKRKLEELISENN